MSVSAVEGETAHPKGNTHCTRMRSLREVPHRNNIPAHNACKGGWRGPSGGTIKRTFLKCGQGPVQVKLSKARPYGWLVEPEPFALQFTEWAVEPLVVNEAPIVIGIMQEGW